MHRLIVSAGALTLLVFSPPAMAGSTGETAGVLNGGIAADVGPRAAEPPAETEMPTADTEAAEEKADDRLPEDRTIDQFGDSIDSGHEGG